MTYSDFMVSQSIFTHKKDAVFVRELFYELYLIPGNKEYCIVEYANFLKGLKCAIRGALDAIKEDSEAYLIVKYKNQRLMQQSILSLYGISHTGKVAIKDKNGEFLKTYSRTKRKAKELIPYLLWHTK